MPAQQVGKCDVMGPVVVMLQQQPEQHRERGGNG